MYAAAGGKRGQSEGGATRQSVIPESTENSLAARKPAGFLSGCEMQFGFFVVRPVPVREGLSD